MKTSIIFACDRGGVIGKDGKLPWHLPEDLKYFKEKTLGYPIIMGRKTFEGLGKPLPGRENIILTRDPNYAAESCTVYNSPTQIAVRSDVGFVIGGAELIQEFLPTSEFLYVTMIDHDFEGDTFIGDIKWSKWEQVYRIKGIKDQKNPYDYYFTKFRRLSE